MLVGSLCEYMIGQQLASKELKLVFVVEAIQSHQVFYDLGTELDTLSRAQ
ncbi:hypothetical protein VHARVF571_320034 [Vibrio harveyi]|nr:hypothetical protein VHARVF571_320034 [Vibrio harveyi]